MQALKQDTEIVSDERGVTAAPGTAKARIERAALELFCERSIEGVSTKSIAAAAGVSEGLLYRHFKSKSDLARTMMVSVHARLAALITAQHGAALDTAVPEIVRGYCALADADWAQFRYHLLYMHRFQNLSPTPADSPLGAAAALIRFAQDAGRLPTGVDPMLLSTMALGVVLQAAQSKLAGALNGPLSDHADLFERVVMTVLEEA